LVIKKINSFEEILEKCLKESSSHYLAEYLFELANKINEFYEKTPILKDADLPRKNARLLIIKRLIQTMETGLDILGIETVEQL